MAGAACAIESPWPFPILAAWCTTATLFVAWTIASTSRLDGPQTRQRATAEDDTRNGTRLLLVIASVVSLPGVATSLIVAKGVDAPWAALLTVGAVVTVAVSWMLVHTVFTLRYADLYYQDPVGGIGFPHDDDPDYWDFAYLGFTVGMTFQVSDTDLSQRTIRHAVLRHALISYVFGAIIVAVTINVLGGLFQ